MIDIYYIGGSPCSGKSTIAEAISKKNDLYYYKVDDFLDKYTQMGAEAGKPTCTKQSTMTPEETWMRNPVEQNIEELQFYEEIFEFILEEIKSISDHSRIITEGAAFTPNLMKKHNVAKQRYVNITPTPEFQISHYRQREWVPYVLDGCSDKEKAFMNWMNRDVLFAEAVREQCGLLGYKAFVNDGTQSVAELMRKVCLQFNMED
jgi:hypothetical protein